jgi:hypothetical protein
MKKRTKQTKANPLSDVVYGKSLWEGLAFKMVDGFLNTDPKRGKETSGFHQPVIPTECMFHATHAHTHRGTRKRAGGHPGHISNSLHLLVDKRGTRCQGNIPIEMISRLRNWRKFLCESGRREPSSLVICHPARELDIKCCQRTVP